jgi:hypothetical protein
MDLLTTFPILAATLLTPVVVYLWAKAFPPEPFDKSESNALRARNGWIDATATVFMFIGLITPLLLFRHNFQSVGVWGVGLMFGLSVILPFSWVCVATFPFGGLLRFREFWRFYELRWRIGIRGIKIVYIPFAMLGLISAAYIWL